MTYSKTYSPCDDCPHSFSKNNQESNVCKICEFKQALDLINRQKAEIEELEAKIEKQYKKGYADGVTEFSERLLRSVGYEVLGYNTSKPKGRFIIDTDYYSYLEKEMVGDESG